MVETQIIEHKATEGVEQKRGARREPPMRLDGNVIGTSNPVMKSVTQPSMTVWADRQRTPACADLLVAQHMVRHLPGLIA